MAEWEYRFWAGGSSKAATHLGQALRRGGLGYRRDACSSDSCANVLNDNLLGCGRLLGHFLGLGQFLGFLLRSKFPRDLLVGRSLDSPLFRNRGGTAAQNQQADTRSAGDAQLLFLGETLPPRLEAGRRLLECGQHRRYPLFGALATEIGDAVPEPFPCTNVLGAASAPASAPSSSKPNAKSKEKATTEHPKTSEAVFCSRPTNVPNSWASVCLGMGKNRSRDPPSGT
eukprot:scaffold825_cov249-Pinguiococcus_pyrenoidosus.AAC.4